MATLRLENGAILTDADAIADELAPLNIQLNQWTLGDNPALQNLLVQEQLHEIEKAQVLAALEHYFEQLQQTGNYASRDLIVLHPQVPNLAELLAKFDRPHTHSDDEVRYILDGEGVFGFIRPDGSQIELTVTATDYINVPAGTEHWFYLTPQRRIKAIRYFSGTEGWVPRYTETAIRFRPVLV
ncbi:MAG: cupin domain-containing protein [Oscillatoriales cyanobacterium C42_A2020_001]|nr:cupin domain-containing protein [Leptolyngbyaceae cyanobacterium C42_A2020_001]